MHDEATQRRGWRRSLTVASLFMAITFSLGLASLSRPAVANSATVAAAHCAAPRTLRGATSASLVCASARRLVVRLSSSGALASVPLLASTKMCRAERGCNATWRDLHAGDILDIGVSPSSPGRSNILSIDANLTTGSGKVTALTAHSLTLMVMGRGGAAVLVRTLSVLPSTVVNSGRNTVRGATQGLHLGDAVFYTASGNSPRLSKARYWAIVLIKMR